jgi:hypothetical protein
LTYDAIAGSRAIRIRVLRVGSRAVITKVGGIIVCILVGKAAAGISLVALVDVAKHRRQQRAFAERRASPHANLIDYVIQAILEGKASGVVDAIRVVQVGQRNTGVRKAVSQ